MMLIHFTAAGGKLITDMSEIFSGRTAMLIGGAPSLKEQPLHLLEQRGMLTMAINNAALHFKPTCWCSVDNPACFDPRILLDPGILKFANISHCDETLFNLTNTRFRDCPNMYFYIPEAHVPLSEFLETRRGLPWYSNSLYAGIHILYTFGVRRIILGGSDFGPAAGGAMYAHDLELTSVQTKWNTDLYKSQVYDIRGMKRLFEDAGLELLDCSKNSRLGHAYKKVTMEEAVDMCLSAFPKAAVDTRTLPHCSAFASKDIEDRVAGWPGYNIATL